MVVRVKPCLVGLGLALIVALALVSDGCGDSKEAIDTPSPTLGSPTPVPPPGLALSLQVGSLSPAGDGVPLKLLVSNDGPDPLPLLIGGTEVNGFYGSYDFLVTNDENSRVWSWVDKPVQLVQTGMTLNSGDNFTLNGDWNMKDSDGNSVPSGVYTISATFRASLEGGDRGGFELATQRQSIQVP